MLTHQGPCLFLSGNGMLELLEQQSKNPNNISAAVGACSHDDKVTLFIACFCQNTWQAHLVLYGVHSSPHRAPGDSIYLLEFMGGPGVDLTAARPHALSLRCNARGSTMLARKSICLAVRSMYRLPGLCCYRAPETYEGVQQTSYFLFGLLWHLTIRIRQLHGKLLPHRETNTQLDQCEQQYRRWRLSTTAQD